MRSFPISLCLAVSLCTGCYEGWEYGGETPQAGHTPRGSEETPRYAYVLFEPIVLESDAIEDTDCFPEAGLAAYREAEWNARIGAMADALAASASVYVGSPLTIGRSDCGTLWDIVSASVDTEPWGDQQTPDDDGTGRMLLHVKAVFWHGDVFTDPSDLVTSEHWTAWQGMRGAGRPAESVHYFLQSTDEDGYFRSWRRQLGDVAGYVYTQSPIEEIDATPEGIEARSQTITADTQEFIEWLHALL